MLSFANKVSSVLDVTRLRGDRGQLPLATVQSLENNLRGTLLTSVDQAYDVARRVWNGMVDKRPAMIARCRDTADVVTCVNFAREHDLSLAVRGGGHNYAGKAICDGGLVIDLSPMKGIEIDAQNGTATAEAGLRLGEFDRATQEFGLATTLGINTDTGISGLTLGGGYGWLAGKYGLACDNLISADIVTSDGRTCHCDEEQFADLFWGLRGAGANFGIVTQFQFRLHGVTDVMGGVAIYSLAEDTLHFFDEFSASAPDELTTVGVVLNGPGDRPAFAMGICHCGSPDQWEKDLKPLRAFGTPLADSIRAQPYLDMQMIFDSAWPPGRIYYNKAHNIRSLSAGAIQTILRYSGTLPTPFSNIALQQLHGAAARVPADATAFPHRYQHFDLLVHPASDDPVDSTRMISWARECWTELQEFAERAVYVNALEDALEEGERRVREAYGTNYERLLTLKRKYDPRNLFRLNSNINPAAIGP
ncbi:MAG: FAD-binding oxidoreductase [Acidobacteria bacterium]|nr:FAD-binding oxidoreductase [Acidobacteriota bacterium]